MVLLLETHHKAHLFTGNDITSFNGASLMFTVSVVVAASRKLET